MNQFIDGVLAILTAIIGIAILAVILNKKSGAAELIQSTQGAFSSLLTEVLKPIR